MLSQIGKAVAKISHDLTQLPYESSPQMFYPRLLDTTKSKNRCLFFNIGMLYQLGNFYHRPTLYSNYSFSVDCFEKRDTSPLIRIDADFKNNLTLQCDKGPDEINVKWVRTGKRSVIVLPNGDLFIANLEKKDSGEYKCIADISDTEDDEVLSRFHLNVKSTYPL